MNGKGCTLSTRRDAPLPPNWLLKRCHGKGKRAFLPSYLHSRLSQYSLSHHNFHFEASKAIRGSVMHLIRLVFSHLVGSYLLYWHNCGVVTNSRQPTPTWPGFPAILQRRSGRNQLPGSYRTTQSGLTHSFHSRQISQEWEEPSPGTLQRVRPAAGVRCPADPLKSPQPYPPPCRCRRKMILQSVNAPTAGPTLPLTGQASAGSHTCPLTRQKPGSSPINLVAACHQAKTWPVASKAQDTMPLTTTALPLHAYTHRRNKGVARRKRQ